MSLPRGSTRRPVAVAMFFLAVVLLGAISFARLPIDLLPDVSYPRLVVYTSYPDVAPAEVERIVTERVEAEAAAVPGVERVTSTSREGVSLVTLRFAWGTDMDFALLNVRERMDNLRDALPETATRPQILRVDPEAEPVMALSVAAGDDLWRTRELAETVFRRRLEQLDGVAQAAVTGGLDREIQVEVDPARLESYGVTIGHVAAALDGANVSAPGGTIMQGRYRYPLRTLGEFTTVAEIAEVVVARRDPSDGRGGGRVRLRDVARVVDGHAERQAVARHDGVEAVGLLVFKESGANTVAVSERVRSVLDQLESEYPSARIAVASTQADFIADSIDNVVQALLLGGVLAFLVLFLFLRDPRYPVAVALAIPISVVGTFALMEAAGVSLNIMSLGGLALGVGMLVDNSIVVLENVFRHRERGLGPLEAAAVGAEEVQGAITASTLTTISVFGPIVYVEGVAGELFGDLSLAVTFSLVASLVVALTLLPALAARFGRGVGEAAVVGGRAGAGTAAGAVMSDRATPEGRGRVGEGAVAVPGDVGSAAPAPPGDVPRGTPDGGDAAGRSGDEGRRRFARTRRLGRRALAVLRRGAALPGRGLRAARGLGGDLLRFWGSGIAGAAGRLARPGLDRFDRAFDGFANRYDRALEWSLDHRAVVLGASAVALAATVAVAGALPRDLLPDVDQGAFDVRLELPEGAALAATSEAAARLESALLDDPGVAAVFSRIGRDVRSWGESEEARGLNTALLQVRVAEGHATEAVLERLGRLRDEVPGASVAVSSGGATALGQVLGGSEADLAVRVRGEDLDAAYARADEVVARLASVDRVANVRVAGERGTPQVQVEILRAEAARHGIEPGEVADAVDRAMRGARATEYVDFDRKIDVVVRYPEDLRHSLAALSTLRVRGVPVRELVRVEEAVGPAEIHREDQGRVVVVHADVARGGLDGAVAAVSEALTSLPPSRGLRTEVGGENEEMRRSFRDLAFAFALALSLVYMILAAQFESFVHPFTILAAVPLALVGAVAALAVTGGGLDTMSLIGLVILVGIVVNDAIVKVDFIRQAREGGMGLRHAVLEAGRVRLRPIVMTTATTVLGLTPMALGIGRGADLRAPLAVAVIGGLLAATVLTLVLVPVVFAVVEEARLRLAGRSPGGASVADPRNPGPARGPAPAAGAGVGSD